ncbi:hypothetical protein BH10PSE7_BH10PSE7_03790 [soil metagenome]
MCTITFKSARGRETLVFKTAARALGEYLLRGLTAPAFKAVILDGRGKKLTRDQLVARVTEAGSPVTSKRKR